MKNERINAEEIYLSPKANDSEAALLINGDSSEKMTDEDISLMAEAENKGNVRVGEIVGLRNRNRKVFRMSDGSEQAVFYPKAVHVFNRDTETFDDADNTLVAEEDGRHFVNGKNDFVARFSREEDNDELFSVERGMHRVTVSAKKNKKQRNKGIRPDIRKKSGAENVDIISFSDIEAFTDYEYSVEANGVKEDIIIKEKASIYRYPFILKCENVTAKLDTRNKRIAFLGNETGQEVFYIPSPFMTDANGATSRAVSYEMRTAANGDIYLTVTADSEWINAEKRAFPVVIDPQIKLPEAAPITTYGWTDGAVFGGMTHTVGTVACAVNTETPASSTCDGAVLCDATQLYLNDWVGGSITYSGERICYKFTADAGDGNYTVATKGSMDTMGYLYDANGCLIKSNDDSNGLNFSMTAQLTGGETYYIEVKAYSTKTGDYSIGVTYSGACASCYTSNRMYMQLEMPTLPNNPRMAKRRTEFILLSTVRAGHSNLITTKAVFLLR